MNELDPGSLPPSLKQEPGDDRKPTKRFECISLRIENLHWNDADAHVIRRSAERPAKKPEIAASRIKESRPVGIERLVATVGALETALECLPEKRRPPETGLRACARDQAVRPPAERNPRGMQFSAKQPKELSG